MFFIRSPPPPSHSSTTIEIGSGLERTKILERIKDYTLLQHAIRESESISKILVYLWWAQRQWRGGLVGRHASHAERGNAIAYRRTAGRKFGRVQFKKNTYYSPQPPTSLNQNHCTRLTQCSNKRYSWGHKKRKPMWNRALLVLPPAICPLSLPNWCNSGYFCTAGALPPSSAHRNLLGAHQSMESTDLSITRMNAPFSCLSCRHLIGWMFSLPIPSSELSTVRKPLPGTTWALVVVVLLMMMVEGKLQEWRRQRSKKLYSSVSRFPSRYPAAHGDHIWYVPGLRPYMWRRSTSTAFTILMPKVPTDDWRYLRYFEF